MKKFVLLLVLAVIVYSVQAITYDYVRPAGTVTPNTGLFRIAMDSLDTFYVDTIYSDTIALDTSKYLYYNLNLDGFTIPDSANDSVIILVTGWGTYNGRMSTQIMSDSLSIDGDLDSTTTIIGTIKIDTLGFNKFYFRTIVSDSFIYGLSADEHVDTLDLYLRYQTLQTVAIKK